MGSYVGETQRRQDRRCQGRSRSDAANHAKQGLYLEHLWRNVDDPEVLFLFRIDDPILAKRFVRKVHAEALKEDPTVNLPLMTYLRKNNSIIRTSCMVLAGVTTQSFQ